VNTFGCAILRLFPPSAGHSIEPIVCRKRPFKSLSPKKTEGSTEICNQISEARLVKKYLAACTLPYAVRSFIAKRGVPASSFRRTVTMRSSSVELRRVHSNGNCLHHHRYGA